MGLRELADAAQEVKRARAAVRAAQRELDEANQNLRSLWTEWMEGLKRRDH